MYNDGGRSDYACRCLNIRLHRRQPRQGEAQAPPRSENGYEPLYVGEDGILVAHNELTLRTRSSISADSSITPSSRLTQHTFVTCLVCDTVAYRITTDVTRDSDSKEGPVLPAEDWAERETLSSRTGWVGVNIGSGGCITGEDIKRLESSSSFSQFFSIALASASLIDSSPSTLSLTRFSIPSSHSFLPSLPPFLPPPPFTPSHPIFLHLSSVATSASTSARGHAEKRIEEFTKKELSSLEEVETQLKSQLELVWRNVREALRKAEKERDAQLFASLGRRRSQSPGQRSSSLPRGSPVIRDFNPSTYHGPRMSRSTVPRQSALSASLAVSAFYHPRHRREEQVSQIQPTQQNATVSTSPPPYASNPPSPGDSSSTSGSSINLSRSLKRNMDETIDAAVTYRWSVLEEQEAKRRKAKEARKKKEIEEKAKGLEEQTSSKADGPDKGSSQSEALEEQSKTSESQPVEVNAGIETKGGIDDTRKDGERKGRRHVTFDTKPAVVTIKREVKADEEERREESSDDLLFDIDDSDADGPGGSNGQSASPENSKKSPQLTLSFNDKSQKPSRTRANDRTAADINSAGLPQSFAALRPSSLPAPSHIRPSMRSRQSNKSTHKGIIPDSISKKQSPRKSPAPQGRASSNGSSDGSLSPHRAELRRLVAADTPSHRGAWSQHSESWRIFDRNGSGSGTLHEVDEDGEDDNDIDGRSKVMNAPDPAWTRYRMLDLATSLPVPMAPVSQLGANGVKSLQPKTSLTERPGTLVPPLPPLAEEDESGKKKSPAAIRRAAYAERDRLRAMDPGHLDFVEEDDGDVSTSPEPEDDVEQISASRGRQHALKILKAGISVPAEGMWRSLAS